MRNSVASLARLHGRARMAPFVFVAPAAFLIVTVTLLPVIAVAAISLTDWHLGAPRAGFVGLSNYAALVSDKTFAPALANTLLYVLMTVPLSLAVGLLVALGINRTRRGQALYQVLYFLPNMAVLAAMAVVWGLVLHPGLGPVNRLLASFGFAAPNWLKDEAFALPSLAVIGLWQGVGFCMIFYVASLTRIDRTLYDAADVDGVRTSWDRFWIVTWPQVAPTTLFLLVVSTVHAFEAFETVAVLTQGGPQGATQVLLYSIYQEGFIFLRANHAATLSIVLLFIVAVLAVLQVKLLDRRVSYR
jgi:multiple sugar transport system permease protein